MRTNQANLLLLLRLMENCLPEAEDVRVRGTLADPEVQSRWQLLVQAGQLDPLQHLDPEEFRSVSPETIAAFIDQRLPADEALQVEAVCWRSLPALCEVVSTFRFLRHDNSQAVSGELSQRLLKTVQVGQNGRHNEHLPGWPNNANGTPPATNNGRKVATPSLRERQWVSEPRQSANRAVETLQVTPDVTARKPPRHQGWMLLAAAIVLVVCVGGIALLLSGNRPDRTAAPKNDAQDSPRNSGTPTQVPKLVDKQNKQPIPPPDRNRTDEEHLLEDDDRSIATDGSNLMKELNLPNDWQWRDDWLVPVKDEQDPKVVQQPTPRRKPIALDWDRIEGVLASRDPASGKWQGVNYQAGKVNSSFATLPQSWASTVPGKFGHMVLAADTEISIGSDSSQDRGMDVSIIRGRLALHDLPLEDAVTLRLGNSRWRLRAARRKSIVGVDLTAAEPRVFVPQGEILVDGQLVESKHQIAWNGERWDAPCPLARRENTSWTERPAGVARLNSHSRLALLSSNDVRSELTRLSGIDPRLVTRWSLAIAPEDTFSRMSSRDANVRAEAIRWLLSLHPRDRRVTTALQRFAAAAGNPSLVRSMSSWIQALRQTRAPRVADAHQLVRGLEHPELAIRHFSAFLLESAFPQRRNAYQPQADPQLRKAEAEQWRRFLQARMRAAAQQPAATRGGARNVAPNQPASRAKIQGNNQRRNAQNRVN